MIYHNGSSGHGPGSTSPWPRPHVPDGYDVIVIRRPHDQWPGLNRKPPGAEEIQTLHSGLVLVLAAAFANAFNQEERLNPRGIWAIIRRTCPPENGNGNGNGHSTKHA